MKTIDEVKQEVNILTEEKKVEILAIINANWDSFYTKEELARFIEQGFIYGPLGNNEHFKIDDIIELVNVVDLEKNPLPVIQEEEIIKE